MLAVLKASAKLEQSNRKQKLNQELNHKCNPDELAKSYVQWKILAQSKQSSFSIADLFSNPTENFNASGNPRLHADRPVSPCNRRWRKPLNQSRKLTCKAQSDMSAQCTCSALKNWFKHNRKTHAAKLSILTLFFLSSFFWCSSCLRRWRNVNLSGHDSCGSSNRT